MDLLSDIYHRRLTDKEVERIYNQIIQSESDPAGALGMSTIEWTAYAHGAQFEEVTRWRYEGWPDVCPVCGEKINNLEEGGWFAGQTDDDGNSYLVHIHCMPDRGVDDEDEGED